MSDDIFPKMDGFETQTDLMKNRTLLEFIMIKHLMKNTTTLPLDVILKEANISSKNKSLRQYLEAVGKNNVVFVCLQGADETDDIRTITHHDLCFECNPMEINLWAKKMEMFGICAFEHMPHDKLHIMYKELQEKIDYMKSKLSSKN